MAAWKLCLLLLLAVFVVLIPSNAAFEDDDDAVPGYGDPEPEPEPLSAVLIARKHIIEDKIVQGSNMTVVVSLYNVGVGYDALLFPTVADCAISSASFPKLDNDGSRTVFLSGCSTNRDS